VRRIFLGKPVHWLLLAVLIGLGAFLGDARLHVREFNIFVAGLFALSAAVVLIVLRTCAPGEQVTRDPLEPDQEQPPTGP
jgi:hypothetical protein